MPTVRISSRTRSRLLMAATVGEFSRGRLMAWVPFYCC
jgi:hypothetical protein